MSSLPRSYLAPEEYLAIERKAEYKSEYFRGEMLAVAGAGLNHNQIASNALILLGQQLRLKGFRTVGWDMRVHVRATGLYSYPDVVVFCGAPQLQDEHLDTLLNPTLIGEVLSPTTEIYDRTRKWERYQSIESLREYLLISSDRRHADLFTLQPSGRWLLSSASLLEDSLEIPSLGCSLPLSELYDQVDL